MKKKWVTLFERYEDFHYCKDVGQIPFHANKCLGFDTELWRKALKSHQEKKDGFLLVDIATENTGTKISIKLILEIIRHAKEIDYFQLFHFRTYTLLYAYIYKFFNKNGVVIIKCDIGDSLKPFDNSNLMFKFLAKIALRKLDLVSAEHSSVYKFFEKKGIPCALVPNGVSNYFYTLTDNESMKKVDVPTIIFVGKCGDPRKNAELAISAFCNLPSNLNWNAYFLGGETSDFKIYFDKKVELYPWIKDKIFFKGFVKSTQNIIELYKKSHIFLMTSKEEGYPISLVEACWMRCFPILSPESGGKDLIENSAGQIYKDEDDLTALLEKSIKNIEETIAHGNCCHDYVNNNNDWRKNIIKLSGQHSK
ncbi:glycosyl transferase [Pectobacterium araliae]|uniref:Glycosyltransferase n=1 Tax=Pectobacterium araliae TaxID=3073862 RepID=A0AAN0K9N6_9GAMM|nr:glycosyltransferase [Pectobacterium sp. MAFF 302110]GKW20902.1 glycosyl transferase [Pectobacterium carotovorum subsp. carotovorum]